MEYVLFCLSGICQSMCMRVSMNGFSRSSILASVNEVPFFAGWQCAAFC